MTPPVVIADVDDHLVSPRPLAHDLADHLHRAGAQAVVCDGAGTGSEGNARVAGAIRHLLASIGGRPALVAFGDVGRQRRLVWGLALAGLLPRVRLVVHTSAARIPFEVESAEVFGRADAVVVESEVGARAVRQCCAEADEPEPGIVVTPPAFPSRADLLDYTARSRDATRQSRIGVDHDALVIGCWVRDDPEGLAPLASSIVAQFTRGEYWQCGSCDHLTAWPLDDHLRPVPRDRCERCRSLSGAVGRSRDDVHLLMLDEPADRADDHIALWGCVDVHLQPHMLADVTVPMRWSCVLNVPIVATRYGAVEERLAGAARLVPPRMILDHTTGHRTALIDRGGVLAELLRLADDHAARRRTAASLGGLPRRWDGHALLGRWTRLLDDPVAA